MKEEIYTIPVIESFDTKSECPFCNMFKKLEDEAVEYMLGPAYMDDEVRIETDKTGFCKEHYKQMFDKNNRLGLALMLHTHIKKINEDIQKISVEDIAKKKSFFAIKSDNENPFISHLNNITNSCFICNRINKFFERYIDTFFYMWTEKKEIKDLVKSSRGFCIPHFSLLLNEGKKKLNYNSYIDFIDNILPIQKKYMKTLEDDVEWFTDKFDYRYKDEPWKNSKDAVSRAINKISASNLKGETDSDD